MTAKRILLTDATIITSAAAPALAGAGLLVEGDRISQLLPAGTYEREVFGSDVRTIDLNGGYVLPGLIDSHSHLGYTPQPGTPSSLNLTHSIEMNTVIAVKAAHVYLKNGFTGVFDMGARGNLAVAIRDGIERAHISGPRVLASGPVISSTGGLMNNMPAWVSFQNPNGVSVDGVTEVRRAVRQQVLSGVDNIKIGASGQLANSTAFVQLLTESELAAAVDEAERYGKTVAAHAYGEEAVEACIRAGIHSVHHGFGGLSQRNLELMAERGTFLVPTVGVFESASKSDAFAQWSPEKRDRFERALDQLYGALSQVVGSELEGRILAGSDSGNSVGQDLAANEIVSLARNGLGVEAAICAATTNAAGVLGRSRDVGSLEPGKLADLVVFSASPVENVNVLLDPLSIKLVMKAGEVVSS